MDFTLKSISIRNWYLFTSIFERKGYTASISNENDKHAPHVGQC